MTNNVHLVSEFSREESPTGVARRIDHLIHALHPTRPELMVLITDRSQAFGLRARIGHVIKKCSRGTLAAIPPGHVVVVGLGAPHMLFFAIWMSRSRRVTFDACDSWLLQFSARSTGRPKAALSAASGALLQVVSPRRVAVSYISERDRAFDRLLNRKREANVVGPHTAVELGQLPDVVLPLKRLVLVGDFASFHNRKGLNIVARCLTSMGARLDFPVEIYGPTEPHIEIPHTRYLGWANSITDIYEGDTGVIATNVGGSGVPNKLIEAIAAERPVFVHTSVARRFPKTQTLVPYKNARQLASLLLEWTDVE